jgi:hypothetical protein
MLAELPAHNILPQNFGRCQHACMLYKRLCIGDPLSEHTPQIIPAASLFSHHNRPLSLSTPTPISTTKNSPPSWPLSTKTPPPHLQLGPQCSSQCWNVCRCRRPVQQGGPVPLNPPSPEPLSPFPLAPPPPAPRANTAPPKARRHQDTPAALPTVQLPVQRCQWGQAPCPAGWPCASQ